MPLTNSTNAYLLPKDTRFLVSSIRFFELDSASEIWHALKATHVCDDAEIVFIRKGKWWLRGLFGVIFDFDPLLAAEKVREYLSQRPWIMEFTQKIIPIEIVSDSLAEIKEFVEKKAYDRLDRKSKWMIRVSKHESKISRTRIIEKIAASIDIGKVDLEKPDWIINIEIIKDLFCASVIKPTHIIRKKDIQKLNTSSNKE